MNEPPFLLLLLHLLVFYFSCVLVQPSHAFSDSMHNTHVPFQLVSLLAVKSSLNDPLSTLNGWDPNKAISDHEPVWCLWSGVKCDAKTSQVTSLNLSRRNLSGLIPAEIRYLSTSLLHLNLSGNSFDVPFPPFIFELTKLRTLDISHNSFNSTFPPSISKLKFLKVFNAYSNSFEGPLPRDVIRLGALEELNLGGSYFEGEIPLGYGSLPRLRLLHLAGNVLTGTLPKQLAFLKQLEHLEIGYNQFVGRVPQEFSLLSNLKYLDVSNCNLSGSLTQELGNLSNLEALYLFNNRFSGKIPLSYSNLKALRALDLSDNNLTGEIPEGFSELKELTWLSLISNNLTGKIPEGIGDLPNLTTLLLWNNKLTGILPQKLGMNRKLLKLDVSSNSLTGPIPPGLCSGNKLFNLILFSNEFENEIPRNLTNCTSLWRFRVQDNHLNGSLPYGFGLLPNLTYVDLSKNRFSGDIPEDLGTSPVLQYLNVSENSLGSTMPENIWTAPNLQVFSASFSNLTGKIPDFVGCKCVYNIELQGNSFNGSIPWDIGRCEKLQNLNLGRNSLTGIIPWEITTLRSITTVDLSRNLLSGTIPSDFGNCTTLQNFNVSYNQLTGRIPTAGSIFPNLHPSSFYGNEGLCGDVVAKPCAADMLAAAAADSRHHHPEPRKTAGAIVWIMAVAFAVGLFVLFAGTRCFCAVNHGRRFADEPSKNRPWKLTAFQRLNFTAEDLLQILATTDTIIGMGSTGVVYKAEMPSGETIAVKKLWGKHKYHKIQWRRGILAEVEVLGNVRHRNIVRLLGYCSNGESTMLLYEYMPNGNLYDLLHQKSKGETANAAADWTARYKIALGIAQGICYLHHDCDPVIVHRDIKPSNILLDGEFEARLADFGVAKLIHKNESMSMVAGSYGYIAPEYAYTLQVNQKSDIYSFGVVLMEIISGKRSVEPEFGEGSSIVDWIKSKIRMREGIDEIFDKNVGADCTLVREEMKETLRIALLCTSPNPADRPSMRDVVLMIQEAEPKRKQPVYGGTGRHGSGGSGLARGDDDCFESSIVIPKFVN